MASKSGQRQDASLPSGAVNVWAALIAEIKIETKPPAGGRTAEQLAQEAGCSVTTARVKLRDDKRFRAVQVKQNGIISKYYVPI